MSAQSNVRSLPERFDLKAQASVPFDGRFLHPSFLVDAPNPNMPLLDAIGTRRTSRHYDKRLVDGETFSWLIEQSMNAPTACNEQQWKVILVDDPVSLRDLHARGSASFLKNTQQCFVLCYNRMTDNRHWDDHIQSGAAFITTFQLLAHSIGVGSCWVGHLPNKGEVRRLFKIHRLYDPVAVVSFGYYAGKAKTLPRKRNTHKVIMRNRFVSKDLVFVSRRRTLLRATMRHVYYKLPPFIRRKLKPYTLRFEKKFYYEIYD